MTLTVKRSPIRVTYSIRGANRGERAMPLRASGQAASDYTQRQRKKSKCTARAASPHPGAESLHTKHGADQAASGRPKRCT